MKRHYGLQPQDDACNCLRINSYKSLSKQTTLTSSRMNTYKKPRGWQLLLTSIAAISMTGHRARIPRKFNESEAIMETAGGPGDRWSSHRKMAGREESPDTVLSHQETFVRFTAGLG
jgi:hypothetical protein